MNALLLVLWTGVAPVDLALPSQAVVTKEGPTQLTFEIEPKATDIYVDKRKLGKAGKVKVLKVRPGKHEIRLVYKKDETEFDVSVARGQSLEVKYAFEDSGNEPPPPSPSPHPASTTTSPPIPPRSPRPATHETPTRQGASEEPAEQTSSL
jgi:hypothetical protein